MRIKYLFGICMAIAFVATSCEEDDLPEINADFLLPLVNGTATIEDLSDLNDKAFTQEVEPEDINNAYTPLANFPIIPAFEKDTVGPYAANLSDYFRTVAVDSGIMEIEFENVFPFPISPGTKIVFRKDSVATEANHIYTYEFTEEVRSGDPVNITTIFSNTSVTNNVFMYLEPLKSRGGLNVGFDRDESQDQLEMNFILKFLDVNKVEFRTEKELSVADTVGIDIFEDDSVRTTGSMTGIIRNSLPVNCAVQLVLLDDNYNIIDSLFDKGTQLITAATTDADGEPTNITETRTTIAFSADRVRNFKNAKHAWAVFDMDTKGLPGDVQVANNNSFLSIKITGDLNVTFDIGEFLGDD